MVQLHGVGKTTLAVKLIESIKRKFDGVFWIDGGNAESFAESVSTLSDEINALSRQKYNVESNEGPPDQATRGVHLHEKVEAVRQWITNKSEDLKLLIVIDDYNESACCTSVRNLLPENVLKKRNCMFL